MFAIARMSKSMLGLIFLTHIKYSGLLEYMFKVPCFVLSTSFFIVIIFLWKITCRCFGETSLILHPNVICLLHYNYEMQFSILNIRNTTQLQSINFISPLPQPIHNLTAYDQYINLHIKIYYYSNR